MLFCNLVKTLRAHERCFGYVDLQADQGHGELMKAVQAMLICNLAKTLRAHERSLGHVDLQPG
jgi:hypothetical protein